MFYQMTGRRWYGGMGWTDSQTASLRDPVRPAGGTQQTKSKRRGCSGDSCFGDEIYELHLGDHTPLSADSAKTTASSQGDSKSAKKNKGRHSWAEAERSDRPPTHEDTWQRADRHILCCSFDLNAEVKWKRRRICHNVRKYFLTKYTS